MIACDLQHTAAALENMCIALTLHDPICQSDKRQKDQYILQQLQPAVTRNSAKSLRSVRAVLQPSIQQHLKAYSSLTVQKQS